MYKIEQQKNKKWVVKKRSLLSWDIIKTFEVKLKAEKWVNKQ